MAAGPPGAGLLLGWVAALGWAGLVTHGMLSRIVPFLVWFHRFSPHVGRRPVPSMRDLLPERRLTPALVLHGAAVVVGAAAIATGWGGLVRAAGGLLAATGVGLFLNLAGALRRFPEAPGEAVPATPAAGVTAVPGAP